MTRPHAVILDLDDTLFDDSACTHAGLDAVARAHGLSVDPADTDSVCFANNPELHRIAGSTSGTRSYPTRIRSD